MSRNSRFTIIPSSADIYDSLPHERLYMGGIGSQILHSDDAYREARNKNCAEWQFLQNDVPDTAPRIFPVLANAAYQTNSKFYGIFSDFGPDDVSLNSQHTHKPHKTSPQDKLSGVLPSSELDTPSAS